MIFAETRTASQRRRKDNRENSMKLLQTNHVRYETYNAGAHLVVHACKGMVDFWPGTGKFITRWDKTEGRGVFKLLKLCGVTTL